MQATRQHILELLRDRGPSTVDDLAAVLGLTPVTVRHHMDVLKAESLIEQPQARHRDTPGRPQFTYQLTPAALAHFPKNYQALSHLMLSEIRDQLTDDQMQRIVGGIARRMAAEADMPGPDAPVEARMAAAARYLTSRGYEASWERREDGACILRTRNCPYHELNHAHGEFCSLDLALVTRLLGMTASAQERISAGGRSCAYLVSLPADHEGEASSRPVSAPAFDTPG